MFGSLKSYPEVFKYSHCCKQITNWSDAITPVFLFPSNKSPLNFNNILTSSHSYSVSPKAATLYYSPMIGDNGPLPQLGHDPTCSCWLVVSVVRLMSVRSDREHSTGWTDALPVDSLWKDGAWQNFNGRWQLPIMRLWSSPVSLVGIKCLFRIKPTGDSRRFLSCCGPNTWTSMFVHGGK